MDNADIINTNVQQTGSFKTRSYLMFGLSGNVTSDTYLSGPGNINDASYRGEFVVPYDAVLTAVAISVQAGGGFVFVGSGDQVVVQVQNAAYPGSGFTADFNTALVVSYDLGDAGNMAKMIKNQTSAITAGDRIRVWLNVTVVSSVSLTDPQVTLCLLSE
jgi:hypothetical protein